MSNAGQRYAVDLPESRRSLGDPLEAGLIPVRVFSAAVLYKFTRPQKEVLLRTQRFLQEPGFDAPDLRLELLDQPVRVIANLPRKVFALLLDEPPHARARIFQPHGADREDAEIREIREVLWLTAGQRDEPTPGKPKNRAGRKKNTVETWKRAA